MAWEVIRLSLTPSGHMSCPGYWVSRRVGIFSSAKERGIKQQPQKKRTKNPAFSDHLCMDLKFEAVDINGLHRATKETAESQRGSRAAAQQTTLSVEVAHFTQDEQNILHRGPTWLADKNRTTNTDSCQRAKSERGTHQNLNLTRAKRSVSTGSRFSCCQPQVIFSAFFSAFWTEPKSLNYSVVDPPLTLPSTALTVQKQTRRLRLSSCSTHKSPNRLFFMWDLLTVNHSVSETTFICVFFFFSIPGRLWILCAVSQISLFCRASAHWKKKKRFLKDSLTECEWAPPETPCGG